MSVNLYKENKLIKIAGNVRDDDTTDSIVTFESGDNLNPVSPTEVPLITSGEKHSSLFKKLSTMAKNVRYLLKMYGTTDISGIADGTVTGVINEINMDTKVSLSSTTKLIKYGKVVYMRTNGWDNITKYVIPEGYRPEGALWVIVFTFSYSTGLCYINSNGIIKLYKQYPTEISENVIMSATWMTT